MHENVTVWLTEAGFGFAETFTEIGEPPVNVAVAWLLLDAGTGWLSVTVHKATTFPATGDVVCQVCWVPTMNEMGDRHSKK